MSYSPAMVTMSDDNNKHPPNPQYKQWDTRSRKELRDRLYEAVDKRREATEELIPRVIVDQLEILGLNNIESMSQYKIYRISDANVICKTHESIDHQIEDWKGLRWWRFNENSVCDSWPKWFKKAKCWQDQNQHKPLGKFWCLIFDELNQYTLSIARCKYPNDIQKYNAVQNCLFSKCIEAILKGAVRFERTRETPLLPVRVLTQSKELQQKLQCIDHGFTLSLWKSEAEANAKRQKQQSRNNNLNNHNNKGQRANVATILNEKCGQHATKVYRRTVQTLQQIIPTLNIDFAAIESAQQNELLNNPYTNSQHHYNPMSVIRNNNNDNNNNMAAPIPPVFASSNHNNNNNNHHQQHQHKPAIQQQAVQRGYGPTRGINNALRVGSQRYSPTLSSSSTTSSTSNTCDLSSSYSDAVSINSGSSGSYYNGSHFSSNLSNDGSEAPSLHSRHSRHSRHSHSHSRRPHHPRHPHHPQTHHSHKHSHQHSHHRPMVGGSLTSDTARSAQLDRLELENKQLKAQLAEIREQLNKKQSSNVETQALQTIIRQMQMQNQFNQMMMAQNMNLLPPPHIPSPMTVPRRPNMPQKPPQPPQPRQQRPHRASPPSQQRQQQQQQQQQVPSTVMLNDGKGGSALYTPNNGTMFYFPTKSSLDDNNNNNNNNNNAMNHNDNYNNNNNNNNQRRTPNTINIDQMINNSNMNVDISIPSSPSDDSRNSRNSRNNDNINNNNNNNIYNESNPSSVNQQPGNVPYHKSPSFAPSGSNVMPPICCSPQTSGVSSSSYTTYTSYDGEPPYDPFMNGFNDEFSNFDCCNSFDCDCY